MYNLIQNTETRCFVNDVIYWLIILVGRTFHFPCRSFSSRFVLKFVHARKMTVLSLVSLIIFLHQKNHYIKCRSGSMESYFNAICK